MVGGVGALGAAGAAACGGTTDQASTASSAPATISFMTDWDTGAKSDIMKQALALFAQRNPKITISKTDVAGGNVREKFAAALAAGTQDDVALFNAPEFPYYRDIGVLVDIAPYLKAAKIDPKIYTYLDPSHSVGAKRFCLPFQQGGATWIFNKTLFQKENVPLPHENWTWNDMADAARRLTKIDDNQYGIGPAMQAELRPNLLPFIGSNGGHHITADLTKTQLLLPETLEVIRWAADRIQRDKSWAAPDAAKLDFVNGNIGMFWGNTGIIGNSLQKVAGKFEWEVMPFPKAPRTGKTVRTYNQQPHGITAKSGGSAGRVDAAFTFIAFMAGRDVQLMVSKDRSSTPVLRELVGTSPFVDPPPANMSLIAKGLDSIMDIRIFNGYADWSQTYATALMDIWTSKVSADAGAKLANDAGDAVLVRLNRK